MFGRDRKPSSNGQPKCTYCGSKDFLTGPSGGVSTNILCANEKCRHWFNWTPMIPLLEDLNKIEPTADERAAEMALWQQNRDGEMLKNAALGGKAYQEGAPATAILMGNTFTSPGWPHVAWLAGWFGAAVNDLAERQPLGETLIGGSSREG